MKAMTGSSTNACVKTAGIADELPGIPVIGNTSFTGDITPEGFIGGYDGFIGSITKVDDRSTLTEIDGIPALKKYAVRRDMDAEQLKGGALLAVTIVSPLEVKDRNGG